MHRVLVVAAVFAGGGCKAIFGGAPVEESDSVAEAQAELVRTMFEDVWSTGDVTPLLGASADSVLFHYRGTSSYTSVSGLEGLIQHWKSAFPDFRMELHDIVAGGDLVAARVTYSGTHEGEWFGIPATGKQVSVDEMMFFRFEDGRLVEMWEVDDQLTMRTQMGLLQ